MEWLVVALVIVFALLVVTDYSQTRRRHSIRQQAMLLAFGPAVDWRPRIGECLTLYRTAASPDLVAEILRATAAKYEMVAQQHGLRTEMKDFCLPRPHRGPITGYVTIEVISQPTP